MRVGLLRRSCIQLSRRFYTAESDTANVFSTKPDKQQTAKEAPPGITVTKNSRRPIYLDLQATTPMDPRVLDRMLPYMLGPLYGNPHSRTHQYGWEAEEAVEQARQQVASLIGADPKEIVFTSGATEANNLAIKGTMHYFAHGAENDSSSGSPKKQLHVITTQTEHKCVLDSCRALEQEGFAVTYLPVGKGGLVNLAELEAAIRPGETRLVSIMAVNNEIGVRQPLAEIGALCRRHGLLLHTDAAQAVGKIPVQVNDWQVDLMSISGHKLYGPKGIGALYVRRRPRRVRLQALISGGGQERGMRSGTLPTPLCVGLGEACALAARELDRDTRHISQLSQRLLKGILGRVPHVIRNGEAEASYPGCLNLSFAHVEGESLLMAMKQVALSSGSACTSASLEPSYVLRALGTDDALAHSSIRFGLGRFTTEAEVDFCIEQMVEQVERLRELSPLWEMVQEGIDLKTIEWSQH